MSDIPNFWTRRPESHGHNGTYNPDAQRRSAQAFDQDLLAACATRTSPTAASATMRS
jgi:hypothetical protein